MTKNYAPLSDKLVPAARCRLYRHVRPFVLPLTLLVLSGACTNYAKRLEAGDCERVYEKLLSQWPYTNRAADQRDSYLQQAYDCLYWRDSAYIARLPVAEDGAYYANQALTYEAMEQRQTELLDKLPSIRRVPLDSLYRYSSRRAAEYYFAQAATEFFAARRGDKIAARRAHAILDRAVYFDHADWTDALAVRNEMFDLGTLRIWVDFWEDQDRFRDYSGVWAVLGDSTGQVPRFDWTEIHWWPTRARIDYTTVVKLTDCRVSGNHIAEDCTTYETDVKVGEEKVEETVTKGDSSWVETKIVDVIETVYGTKCEITQSKSSHLSVVLSLLTAAEEIEAEWPVPASYGWSNEYDECSGDSRAVPSCFGSCSAFPSRDQMQRGAARALKNQICTELRRHFHEDGPLTSR